MYGKVGGVMLGLERGRHYIRRRGRGRDSGIVAEQRHHFSLYKPPLLRHRHKQQHRNCLADYTSRSCEAAAVQVTQGRLGGAAAAAAASDCIPVVKSHPHWFEP
ncbi:hypothetical protein E2C01_055659 [Portunus trituberculatus]|uniref:Uncharacterized protein n=1 Tax=Portunus trituberculatus TaxID=210409 RepID=A0A5B7GW56_PORTR|nr:hypothetical protein [Portunus trituberculatus]